MSEPDELYTLRAQYWLGHYQMALDEAKNLRMTSLKEERDVFSARANIGLGKYDAVDSTETPALQALSLKAQFHAQSNPNALNELQTLSSSSNDPFVRLTAAQVLLEAGQTQQALALVFDSSRLEHLVLCLQIQLQLNRLDLAKSTLNKLQKLDEDSILTQIASVLVHLSQGQSGAAHAQHTLQMLSEQYGSSPVLANWTACALLQQGDYVAALQVLEESVADGTVTSDTMVNQIVAKAHSNQSTDDLVQELQQAHPQHSFCDGLTRVTTAFDREAVKYQL